MSSPIFEDKIPELAAFPPAAPILRPPSSFLKQQQPQLPSSPGKNDDDDNNSNNGSRSSGSQNERGSFKRDTPVHTSNSNRIPPKGSSSAQLKPSQEPNQPRQSSYTPNFNSVPSSPRPSSPPPPNSSPRSSFNTSMSINYTSNIQNQPSFMSRSMLPKDKSTLSRFGSSVSRAFGVGSPHSSSMFNRNSSSFIKSWSMNYVRGQVIPPITTSTIRKEDCQKPYPTDLFGKDYLPFWLLCSSFFIMFTAYSLVLNLLTSVYGTNASLAIGILYVFFVFSSMTMPSINLLVFKNNTIHAIFVGSFGNTIMMICSIFGYFPVLLVGAVVVGCGGGLVWVGYNSVLSVISRHIVECDFIRDTKRRLHKRLKTAPQTQKENDKKVNKLVAQLILPNGRINLQTLTDEQAKRIMISTARTTSLLTLLGWCFNSLNSVAGGLISYFMLSSARQNPDPVSAARPLFILFSVFGVVANAFYYLTYRNTPTSMFESNEQPLQIVQHDENRINDNIDIVDAIDAHGVQVHRTLSSASGMLSPSENPTSPHVGYAVNLGLFPVVETVEENEEEEPSSADKIIAVEEAASDLDIPGQNISVADSGRQTFIMNQKQSIHLQADMKNITVGQNHYSSPPQPTSSTNPEVKSSSLSIVIRSLYLMSRMLTQRPIYLALCTFLQMLFPITLYVSFFTASSVKPALGTENIPITMIIVYLTDAIAALAISKIMKGFIMARWCSIAGTCVQLLFVFGVMGLPYENWIDYTTEPLDKTRAWITCGFLAMLCGVGDALMQSGTNASLGILVEGSSLVRSGGFGIAQVCKSTGSVIIFVSARLVSFHVQTYIVLFIIVASLIFQVLNIVFHIPLDVDKLMMEYNLFVEKQTALPPTEDNSFLDQTTLEGLGSKI